MKSGAAVAAAASVCPIVLNLVVVGLDRALAALEARGLAAGPVQPGRRHRPVHGPPRPRR
ncbi:predicted protein [Streptomyces sp. C]|nr:predicted protein [Streptomyces sp. C]